MGELPAVGFIGAGRAARAIGPALEAAGCGVVAVASRGAASARRLAGLLRDCEVVAAQDVADRSDLVFITTNDGAIAEVAEQVAWRPGQSVVHCSGALTLAPLEAPRRRGAPVGSWHPVQTFAEEASAGLLKGTTIGIEAEGPLHDLLADLARRVGGTPLDVPPAARPLYHAAAVMACGYVTTLLHEAVVLWETAGLPREAARHALTKLAETTVVNVRRQGAQAALTGPAARGDQATVRLHLDALADAAPDCASLYRTLAARSVALAGGGPNWHVVLSPASEEV